MKTKSRKKTYHKTAKILLVVILLIGFWWFENFSLNIVKTTIPSSKTTDTINIVHISDLHGHEFGSGNKRLIKKISALNPDLIFVTGDMFTNGDTRGMDIAIQTITRLCDTAPVYFVPGEHDHGQDFLFALESAGVHVMCYKTETIEIKGNPITIYGINNVYYSSTFDLHNEFDAPDSGRLALLLAHIPNYDAFMNFGADVTFCGDTHGGVVQLPFLGPMYFEGEWFPEITKGKSNVTDRGLFSDGQGHSMYVSPGLGNYPYPVRLFNRPEISYIQISPEE